MLATGTPSCDSFSAPPPTLRNARQDVTRWGMHRRVPLARSLSVVLATFAFAGCGSSDDVGNDIPLVPDDTGITDDTAPRVDAGNDGTAGDTFDAPGDAAIDTTPFDATGEPPLVKKPFTPSAETFLGPERGWMDGSGIHLLPTDDYASIRAAGYTLAYAVVRLDPYRTTATLPAKLLTDLDAGFAKVRAAKIKVILRFTYNDPNEGSTQDAAVDIITGHIAQVTAVVHKNADVVAVWQAGFMGQWGEWHDSTNGLETPGNRKKIIDAIVAALPPGLTTQVRTPMFKAEWSPTPLTDAQAFDGSAQSRIGHHNDCFLANDTDFGTYATPVDTWKSYVASDTRFTPMGGETCALFPSRTDCTPALAEAERLHWAFMNDKWNDKVVAAWKVQGCYDKIGKSLGYRLSLTEAEYGSAVRPGGILQVKLAIENSGWASLYNPRPVVLTLDDGPTMRTAILSGVDPRRWAPGTTANVDVRVRIPATMTNGKYKLSLWLPDAAKGLQLVPEYSVRLANPGVWDARGTNLITDALVVDDKAGGAVDPSATNFTQL